MISRGNEREGWRFRMRRTWESSKSSSLRRLERRLEEDQSKERETTPPQRRGSKRQTKSLKETLLPEGRRDAASKSKSKQQEMKKARERKRAQEKKPIETSSYCTNKQASMYVCMYVCTALGWW
jgi:hypothetical protein